MLIRIGENVCVTLISLFAARTGASCRTRVALVTLFAFEVG